jgi:hypothetical protein
MVHVHLLCAWCKCNYKSIQHANGNGGSCTLPKMVAWWYFMLHGDGMWYVCMRWWWHGGKVAWRHGDAAARKHGSMAARHSGYGGAPVHGSAAQRHDDGGSEARRHGSKAELHIMAAQ